MRRSGGADQGGRMNRIALAAALTLAIAAPAAAQSPARPYAAPETCAVSASFGSYAMGIDQRSFERVQRYVASQRRLIVRSSIQTWGREGERTVCVTTTSRRATQQVFSDIRSIIRKRAERGPTEVRTAAGQVWQSNPRPSR